MRTPKRVKQKMYLASFHDGQPLYAKDDEGNIIYDVMPDGAQVPRQIGETPAGYDTPIEFYNSITSTLTEDELQAFGTEPHTKAKMTFKRDELDIHVSDLIWKESEVEYIDGLVDENSADYRVIGIQDTGRHFFKALMVQVL